MKETSKIYVDIESLFDLRQAVLYQLCEKDKLIAYLNSDEYNLRSMDRFSIVDQAQYDKLYNERDKSIIPYSVITYILNSLKSKIDTLEKRNAYFKENTEAEIILNIYPFKLTAKEAETFQNLLFIKLETSAIVTIVSMSSLELSPYFIKNSRIVSCFIYNFKDWMNIHSDTIESIKLTETIMYFPALHYDDHSEDDLKKIKGLGFKDMFAYVEFLLASVASINFLPVIFYSNLITSSLYVEKYTEELKKMDINDFKEN